MNDYSTALRDTVERLDQLIARVDQQADCYARLAQELQRLEEERNNIRMNVILVTYNQEKYIEKTLETILNQKTDFRFNILVADDCSRDRTVELIQAMEAQTDIPFVYLDNSRNLGIMNNYRRAFAACDAEYVAIMEGDDLWIDPYRLQKHKDFLDAHPECAMSFNRFIVKNFEKGEENTQPILTVSNEETYRIFTGHDLAHDNLIGNFSTSVYKNAYLQNLPKQLYDVHAYDWLTNIFMSQMGRIGCLLQPMSIYRIHSGGVWSNKRQQDKLQEIIDLTEIYDKLTNREFTVGFTANRNRLKAQLAALEEVEHPHPAAGRAVPTPAPRTLRQKVKSRLLLPLRQVFYFVLDCTPPFITAIVKWIVPPRLVRKVKMMREV